jgi:hypothetical protein
MWALFLIMFAACWATVDVSEASGAEATAAAAFVIFQRAGPVIQIQVREVPAHADSSGIRDIACRAYVICMNVSSVPQSHGGHNDQIVHVYAH